MGKVYTVFLDDEGEKYYTCSQCHTHLAKHSDVISKSFQGRTGRALLFGKVCNVQYGPTESRQLMTGMHTVQDISCIVCGNDLGWKYVEAMEASQRYKVNKVIVEKSRIVKENCFKLNRAS